MNFWVLNGLGSYHEYGRLHDRVFDSPERYHRISGSPHPLSTRYNLLNSILTTPQGTHLALIHIPIDAYSHFVQPILQLLLESHSQETEDEITKPSKPWASIFPFVNISISPNECSVVCPRDQAVELFTPILKGLEPSLAKSVSISEDDYSVIMIGGEGLEAGQRVLDLTTPLALAGM